MSTYPTVSPPQTFKKPDERPAWRRLTPGERQEISRYAVEHGAPEAAEKFRVSLTAVRRSCALNGVLAKCMTPRITPETKASRIATARAMLRSMGLTPADLFPSPDPKPPGAS